ncbi:uncharacterized protein LOC123521618 [Echinops telfairi]|uniref:Uncharacterized protein LOC123521618 n=1 Tax=Echinops telfairi TaxID=9371 RepID=A0AC55D153_ECHTE|nr:uncharacterized protein LOC123521618 [Echinops telfairi]
MRVVLRVPKDAQSTSYVEGSFMTLEASIQPALNWTRKLYVDECVGTQSQQLNHSQRLYTLIFNYGCLSIGSIPGHWFRKDNGTVQFSVGAFMLQDDVDESEIFVTCWVSIWSWRRRYGHSRKSCFYNATSHSWQFANNEGDSSLCDCCDFGCPPPKKGQHKEFPQEGESQMVVMGPLKVRKPPAVSWFRASCRTLKELLLVALAFTCVALLFLLILRTLLWAQLPCLPVRRQSRLRRSSLTSLESPEMDLIVRDRCSSGEENEASPSTVEESL